ncbi:serine hydroxymethyltransferase [Candidatus Phytoplasma oryzae]|nr:serine hydroxymethyltransferase [Candidatus Phytoplasma oryzae]
MKNLKKKDLEIYKIIQKEKKRQKEHIELIASENFVSKAVLEAQGSILTNKYVEGYIGNRYYCGCEFVDQIEKIALERVKKLFKVKFANVQPHSGSQANMAVFQALLKPNDRILGMSLNNGGHLSHGSKFNFSGNFLNSFHYGVSEKKEIIDYENVRKIAYKIKPKLIIVGASAYSRQIDFIKFRQIADEVKAYLMADIAHIAGLIACNLHPSPFEAKVDVITSTTHKTLRGPRGGIILSNNEQIMNKINKGVFPGIQGGALMHIIAAKAVSFEEALDKKFIAYQKKVLKNAKILEENFKKKGYRLISGGTDNHLLMIDIKHKNKNLNGKIAADILNEANITVNKNVIPFDKEKIFYSSGIRIGTSAMTTRGFTEKEFIQVANLMDEVLNNYQNKIIIKEVKKKVIDLTSKFPFII